MTNDALKNTNIGELIEPEAINYSFDTLGWYFVAAGLFIAIFIFVSLRIRMYRRNAYRRQAIKQIEMLKDSDGLSVIYEINKLIKITAIDLYGRLRVGSLHGAEWFDFLTMSMNSEADYNFEAFNQALYNPSISSLKSRNEFIEFACLWFTKHKVHV